MNQNTQKYQSIILQDVQGEHYDRNKRTVWYAFYSVTTLSLALYVLLLIKRLASIGFDFSSLIVAVQGNPNQALRITLYFHETALLILGFVMAAGIFGLLGFFIYDFQQRNEVIREQIRKTAPKDEVS